MNDLNISALEESLGKLRRTKNELEHFRTLSQLGHACQAKQQYQKSLVYFKQAYELVKNRPNPGDLIVALVNIGAIYWEMAQLKKATKNFHDSLVIVEGIGDDVGRRMLYSIIGISNWRKGEFFKAIKWFEDALNASTEAKVECERFQLVRLWKYEILQVIMERGIMTLKNRIQIARNQSDLARILLPSFAMIPLMLFTGQKGELPNLYKEIVPLAKELKRNKILDAITAIEKTIRASC